MRLDELKCEACHSGSLPLSDEALSRYLAALPEWRVVTIAGTRRLTRCFTFSNYKQAWDFTHIISQLAEREFHHPSLLLEWGKVTVTWWTHDINGLHINDVICAMNTDKLYGTDAEGRSS